MNIVRDYIQVWITVLFILFCNGAIGQEMPVDIFNTEKPDVILMDIHMPEMDGIETTLKISEIEKLQHTETPVKIISMSAPQVKKKFINVRMPAWKNHLKWMP